MGKHKHRKHEKGPAPVYSPPDPNLTFAFERMAKPVRRGHVLCFAYGSNMNVRQMMVRCPQAEPAFTATLDGYRLIFVSNSPRWGGGVATMKDDPKSCVQGIVWKLTPDDLHRLDGFEGYPLSYDRESVQVQNHNSGGLEWVTTYMKAPHPESMPSAIYLETIMQGYDWAGLRPSRRLMKLYEETIRSSIFCS